MNKVRMTTLCATVLVGSWFAASLPAAAATTVITFDNLVSGDIAANDYNGVVFTGASVLTQNDSLNAPFPPESPPNVVFDYLDGTITLDFTANVSAIGAFITGNTNITETIFNGTTVLGTVDTGGANYIGSGGGAPNDFLNLSSTTNITSAVFTNGEGVPNTFTMDNVTIVGDAITQNGVPEPATWALMLMGFGGLGAVLRSGRKAAVSAV